MLGTAVLKAAMWAGGCRGVGLIGGVDDVALHLVPVADPGLLGEVDLPHSATLGVTHPGG